MAYEYIPAATDCQLSSSKTRLLSTLLSEEDQLHYNQLLRIQLSFPILQILNQVIFNFFIFHISLYHHKCSLSI